MATFEYATSDGKTKTFEATDAAAALKSMPGDAARTSGVSAVNSGSSSSGSGGSGGSTGGSAGGSKGGADPFMDELTKRMLGQADLITSKSSEIESKITDAIGGVRAAQEASAARIESEYSREKEFATGQAKLGIDTHLEGRTGFGTQMVALRNLVETTDKNLKDLDMRRNELILAGEAEAAGQIAGLQMKALEYKLDAEQRVFDNLLGIGGFANQVRQTNLAFQREAREATQFDLTMALEKDRFAFDKATTLEEQRMSRIRINIAERELKLKEVGEGLGLAPDPGYATVAIQNEVGGVVNNELMAIQAQVEAGDFTTQEEEEAATVAAYMKIRRQVAKSQVTDDALADAFGLGFDDSGELGTIGVETTSLPGEEGNMFDFLGEFYGVGARAAASAIPGFGPFAQPLMNAFNK